MLMEGDEGFGDQVFWQRHSELWHQRLRSDERQDDDSKNWGGQRKREQRVLGIYKSLRTSSPVIVSLEKGRSGHRIIES